MVTEVETRQYNAVAIHLKRAQDNRMSEMTPAELEKSLRAGRLRIQEGVSMPIRPLLDRLLKELEYKDVRYEAIHRLGEVSRQIERASDILTQKMPEIDARTWKIEASLVSGFADELSAIVKLMGDEAVFTGKQGAVESVSPSAAVDDLLSEDAITSGVRVSYNAALAIQARQIQAGYTYKGKDIFTPAVVAKIKAATKPLPKGMDPDEPLPVRVINELVPRGGALEDLAGVPPMGK